MSVLDKGNTAFPVLEEHGSNYPHIGMMLRDYFAAQLVGQLCCGGWPDPKEYAEMAKRAYGVADAMLEERGK